MTSHVQAVVNKPPFCIVCFAFFVFTLRSIMPQCAALFCNNSLGKALYSFPHDKSLRKSWEIALKRKNFKATAAHRVCEDHFEDKCFTMNREEARRAGFKKVGLLPGSVPTIFGFCRKPRSSLATTKRRNLEVS